MMSFGIESITQEGLDNMEKSWLQVKEHKDLIRTLSGAGILVSSEMMLGTDSDTEESIRATWDFIRETRIPIPRFYILTPTPGSPLFDRLKEENRLLTEDLKEYDGSKCVFQPARISPGKLTEMFWWLYNRIFSWSSILARTILNRGFIKHPRLHLFALAVNIHYRTYIRKKIPPNIF